MIKEMISSSRLKWRRYRNKPESPPEKVYLRGTFFYIFPMFGSSLPLLWLFSFLSFKKNSILFKKRSELFKERSKLFGQRSELFIKSSRLFQTDNSHHLGLIAK
jgi:hypothetical protein